MPAKCNRCGEYTLCRKILKYCDLTFRPEWSFNEWICMKCDRAETIITNQRIDESKAKANQARLDWIKERDKILKQHEKR